VDDQEARDYHRALYEYHESRLGILSLNRELASYKSENQKLKDYIADLKKVGNFSHEEQVDVLLTMLEEKHPGERATRQRKEIANLHKTINRLKAESE
jgi:cell division protein FtsB